jgi:hypothetical protein
MSIFSRIKDVIFGHQASGAAPAGTTPGQQPQTPRATPVTPAPSGIPASPADAKWDRPVDVEQVMTELAARSKQSLNWKTSIVDLMKLLGIDSSLENRKELARELGYTGDASDSATMNVWLHKRVLQELEKNGGKVPASLIA